VFDKTRTGISLADGGLTDDSDTTIMNINSNYVGSPGTAAAYNVSLSGSTFGDNLDYEIEFVFTDEDSTSVSETCQPE
jgi:hypothetical protein